MGVSRFWRIELGLPPPKSTPMAYRLLRYKHVKLINSEVEREGAQQVEFANIKARKINFK